MQDVAFELKQAVGGFFTGQAAEGDIIYWTCRFCESVKSDEAGICAQLSKHFRCLAKRRFFVKTCNNCNHRFLCSSNNRNEDLKRKRKVVLESIRDGISKQEAYLEIADYLSSTENGYF